MRFEVQHVVSNPISVTYHLRGLGQTVKLSKPQVPFLKGKDNNHITQFVEKIKWHWESFHNILNDTQMYVSVFLLALLLLGSKIRVVKKVTWQ